MPELDDIEQLFALKEFKKACDDALENSCVFMLRSIKLEVKLS